MILNNEGKKKFMEGKKLEEIIKNFVKRQQIISYEIF